MQTDYLIIGQGLCGSWLSYYLQRAGAAVTVIDKGSGLSASRAASGVINPITGKRLARQWMGETMLPFALQAYEELGRLLRTPLAAEISIHTFFSSAEEAALFERKATDTDDEYLHWDSRLTGEDRFNMHYGAGTIHPAWLVDVRALLEGWRIRLDRQGCLVESDFDWNELRVLEGGVRYRELEAKAVIDCSGAASAGSPFFSLLPFALNKGEALIASIPGIRPNAIYKYANLSLVPWMGEHFWVGSTFDWDFTDNLPTAAFRQKAESILSQWLRVPFTLHDHFAAIRPATVTRDAFSGLHPQHPQIGILNGMGSKGCSLAPFLAHNFAEHLVHGTALIPQVDVARYAKTLSR